mmetsp:Transcript_30267/g.68369  ORF Transcript_30267/g.68369 Transcript_30267/m.68369 type:complete len:273 (-) Transcript_30267:262-1080(-)
MDPTRGSPQSSAVLPLLALQQKDLTLARRYGGSGGHEPASHRVGWIDAPFLQERCRLRPRRWLNVIPHRRGPIRTMSHKLSHVEPDTSRADNRDRLPHWPRTSEYVEVGHHRRMVLARDPEGARGDTRGEDDLVEAGGEERGGRGTRAEVKVDTTLLNLVTEIADSLVELLFARDLLGEVELAAYSVGRLVQSNGVPSPRRCRGECEASRPSANNCDLERGSGGCKAELSFVASARVDQTACPLQLEGVIEARLIACDAGVDSLRLLRLCFQ